MENAIYSTGEVGQVIVLDHVHLQENSSLAQYQQPAFFMITNVACRGEHISVYDAKHLESGDAVTFASDMTSYIYDLEVWKNWKLGEHAKKVETLMYVIDGLQRDKRLLIEVISDGFSSVRTVGTNLDRLANSMQKLEGRLREIEHPNKEQ